MVFAEAPFSTLRKFRKSSTGLSSETPISGLLNLSGELTAIFYFHLPSMSSGPGNMCSMNIREESEPGAPTMFLCARKRDDGLNS